MPQVTHVDWLKRDKQLIDVNILLKTQSIELDHCLETTMEIVDVSEFQFDQYECRAENQLGHKSTYVDLQQISRSKKKHHRKQYHYDESNRNGRTALFINQQNYTNSVSPKSLSSEMITSSSSSKTSGRHFWWILSLSICWYRPV